MSSNDDRPAPPIPDFLNGGGEMGALIRAHDWASTPLGPPESWPRALRTAIRLILNTGHPMYIWWGPDLLCFYNDAYRGTLGPERHPGSLGRPGREVWAEIWPLIGHQVDYVMAGQGSTWDENRAVPITRFGRLDEIYWTYSYSPIDDEQAPGGVGGVLVVCTETTEAVLAERRRAAETERQRRLFEQAPGFITILTGPDHVFEFVNAAYRRQFGDRDYVGKTVRQAFPELAGHDFFDWLDSVYASGERYIAEHRPIRLERNPGEAAEERFLDFIYEPVLDESGAVTGIFVEGHDVTAAHLAETELRAGATRQAFRLGLEERLRDLANPAAAIAFASEALGRHLGADQVAYAEVEPGGESVLIEREWNEGAMPSNAGRHRLDDYGPAFISDLRHGRTIVIPDIRLDPRTSPPQALAAFARASIQSFLNVPVVKSGELVAVLAVHSAHPRPWSADEVALAEEIANRTWSAAERARAEASLREAEERYLALFNAIDQAFCTIEIAFDDQDRPLDYCFLEVSPSFERQTGIENAPGRWMREIAPDQDQHWFDTYGRVARTGEPARFENYSTPLGRWWDVYAFRISGPRRIAVLFRDITAQKRSEAALRDSEARLRELADTLEHQVRERTGERNRVWEMSRDLFAIMGFDGLLKAINPAWETTFGRDSQTLLSLSFREQVHPDDHPAVMAMMERLLRGESVDRFEDRIRHADGSWRWISWTLVPEGEVFYAVGRDVTAEKAAAAELEHAQEALRQSQKMEAMGQLTGGVAHDFNNLLTPIVGTLDMLQRKGLGGEREQRLVAGAVQSADRAKTLVQRLLAFARRQPLQPTAVDVAKLVTGMADLVASTSGPQIRVVVEAAEDLPAARADPNQLEMALLNLGVNARDAMPDGGTLRITAGAAQISAGHPSKLRPGEYIRLSVADTGIGMDEATRAKAIEPFFSTKGIGKGTGLGLSMAHGLASQLGGALTIESRLGLGTNIELWLPLSDAPPPLSEQASQPPLSLAAKGTALLVDDEELVRMSTADMLGDLGYQVVEANSAEDALRLLREGVRPDLVVTDHLMPGMNGTELAQIIQAERPEVEILIVSGYAEAEGIAPDLPRLTKPFRRDDLAAKLMETAGLA